MPVLSSVMLACQSPFSFPVLAVSACSSAPDAARHAHPPTGPPPQPAHDQATPAPSAETNPSDADAPGQPGSTKRTSRSTPSTAADEQCHQLKSTAPHAESSLCRSSSPSASRRRIRSTRWPPWYVACSARGCATETSPHEQATPKSVSQAHAAETVRALALDETWPMKRILG